VVLSYGVKTTRSESVASNCDEFPSLSWLAPSPEKALSGIHKVVADVVEEMTASGESVQLWFTEPLQPKPPNKV
jgi:hypothetical protein